ncbi:phage protein Gp36 family protein [Sphingobium aromaticiconvertens]|uniref:phage protein Gp36 family protein n=1 Tax=Sphingobium aromaticiconvertens TaxID=365341 RepID=UPI003018049C
MALETILKQPSETIQRSVTFNGVATIAALHSVGSEARGLVSGAAALDVVSTLFAGALTLAISGGTDGERYLVTAIADDAEGDRAETELEIVVIDAAWSMPDGGAPYLSIAEFVERFTLQEVVRMADPVGHGRIDRGLLVGALINAQAVADAHVAGRYTVPLVDVPFIIKKIVGDLARAELQPNGDGVEAQLKASMRMLERIQTGAMPIPVATPPAEAASDTPILIAPGRRAYPDGLAGY